ncbi:MAG: sigma-54-dependent Fis family transcriptional regulator [Deltaproteobacteria bacterium]|nr:sigma-54-dependent Fis family transcriptional regulator [Deltaproteobacteria bacterium]
MMDKEWNETILVVDDSPDTLEIIARNLKSVGFVVYTANSVTEAISVLDEIAVNLVITDYKMPRITGMDLIRHVRENYESTQVMMITGYATIEGAVKAVKYGAEEYLAKPFTDEELIEAVKRVISRARLRKSGSMDDSRDGMSNFGLLGESDPMQKVFSTIHKAAQISATVLITGESGTGKELVARAIHYSSKRASATFVPINCGGIPEGLLESELFGYVKGAFTGASESRAGFFQTGDGGTIFLDEISETSLAMQVKLLRVLQEKEVCMVGSHKSRKVNVRILAATNKDLLKLVEKGIFREDLFYRLNVITIYIPPLREREGDIVLLARHFAKKFAREMNINPPKFTGTFMDVLMGYHWPGNVRELENLIQRLIVMVDKAVIDVTDLPPHMRFSAVRGQSGPLRTLAEVETEHIRNVLAASGGNKTKAAQILGIDRKTLRNKLGSSELDE